MDVGPTLKGPGKLLPPFEDVVIEVWGQTRVQWLERRQPSTAT